MVVWRRTLYCKLGQTGKVLELSKELGRHILDADDSVVAHRVYTDLSGRTDRVITEVDRETLVHPRESSAHVHGNPEALRVIQQLGPLVESAEVEFLSLESSRRRGEP